VDAVPTCLADAAVEPGDPAYSRLTSTYFRDGAPGIVLLPRTVERSSTPSATADTRGCSNKITAAFATEVAALLRSGSVPFLQVRTLGGATADVSPDATAFAHREAQFQVNVLGAAGGALDGNWARIRPHLDGIYLSFETDLDPARLGEAFPPATLARLRALKRQLDPHNLFRDNFNIDPAATNTGEPELQESHQRHLMAAASRDDRAAQSGNAVSTDPKEKP
jgi:Berberine and berberine like